MVDLNKAQLVIDNLFILGFTVKDGQVWAGRGDGLTGLWAAGAARLAEHVEEINRLNVFPVADGDTGVNMLITMRAALAAADRLEDGSGAGAVAQAMAHGALMEARGNSGVILAQFLAGLAQRLAGLMEFSAADLAEAMQLGSQLAYQSVAAPVEGTILTVAQAAAHAAGQSAALSPDLTMLLARITTAAKIAQAATPDLLPVLKAAGVTDSGGLGLVYLFEGALRFMLNQPFEDDIPAALPLPEPARPGVAAGYEVQFLIHGENLNITTIKKNVETMGESVVVAGDETLVKVHVHTLDPGPPLSYGVSLGEISAVVVEPLLPPPANGKPATAGVVCLSPGPGFTDIFESLGIEQIVDSAAPPAILRQAIESLNAGYGLVVVNQAELLPAVETVIRQADRPAQAVWVNTAAQSVAALLAFDPAATVEANRSRMIAAAQRLRTMELWPDTALDSTVVWGRLDAGPAECAPTYAEVALALLGRAGAGQYTLATLYFGQNASPYEAELLAEKIMMGYHELEVEIYFGGQPQYQYIISLE